MSIDLIIFLACMFLATAIYIVEEIIKNKIKKKGVLSSTMILEASRTKPAELPKPAEKLILDGAQISKWLMPLYIVRYLLLVVAIGCWFV